MGVTYSANSYSMRRVFFMRATLYQRDIAVAVCVCVCVCVCVSQAGIVSRRLHGSSWVFFGVRVFVDLSYTSVFYGNLFISKIRILLTFLWIFVPNFGLREISLRRQWRLQSGTGDAVAPPVLAGKN